MELYQQVVEVAGEYFGSKAETFVSRVCRLHMGIDPHKLTEGYLESLAFWCYMSGSLTMDRQKALKLQRDIQALKEKATPG